MIRIIFVTLVLVISATLADITRNRLATTITWKDGVVSLTKRTAIYKNYAFLAFRRFEVGTDGITLARMSLKGNHHRQDPFPNLAMQESGQCSALQDVVDIFIDPKGILWVLDVGKTIFSTACQPKIVAFNATTREVVRTISMSKVGGGFHYLGLSRIVVDYNRECRPFVYVSERYHREILVISSLSCIYGIPLPDSAILDRESDNIALNLVRKRKSKRLLINDESREKMYYLKLEDVPACSRLPGGLLKTLGSNNKVILGNNNLSTMYYREKWNWAVVHKYDAFDATVPWTVAYHGNSSALVHHVVPDYTRGGMRLLELNTVTKNNSNVDIVSLKLI